MPVCREGSSGEILDAAQDIDHVQRLAGQWAWLECHAGEETVDRVVDVLDRDRDRQRAARAGCSQQETVSGQRVVAHRLGEGKRHWSVDCDLLCVVGRLERRHHRVGIVEDDRSQVVHAVRVEVGGGHGQAAGVVPTGSAGRLDDR